MRKIWIVGFGMLVALSLLAPYAGAATATGTAHHAHAVKAKANTAPAGKVDINSASKEDLAKLPVIGDVTADKIIAGRPYKTKRDLLARKIMTEKQYTKIKDMIIAKQ